MSATAATGRMKRPIEKPVTKLNVIRKPARLQARNHHHPRPLGSPCRLHATAAATITSNGQAKIISTLNGTPLEEMAESCECQTGVVAEGGRGLGPLERHDKPPHDRRNQLVGGALAVVESGEQACYPERRYVAPAK
jgi:hypothetical protein